MRLGRLLEAGAKGIMYPRCDDAKEAREVVRWSKFAPLGERGFDGANPDQPYCSMPNIDGVHGGRQSRNVHRRANRAAERARTRRRDRQGARDRCAHDGSGRLHHAQRHSRRSSTATSSATRKSGSRPPPKPTASTGAPPVPPRAIFRKRSSSVPASSATAPTSSGSSAGWSNFARIARRSASNSTVRPKAA